MRNMAPPTRKAAGEPKGRRGGGGSFVSPRLVSMRVAAVVAAVVLAGRLVQLQVLGGAAYRSYGQSQMLQRSVLPTTRGPILDRNGAVLAISVPRTDIYADPRQVSAPGPEAAKLAPLLKEPVSLLQAELSSNTTFVYLKRQVGNSVTKAVEALGLAGINFLPDNARYAPNGNLAAGVLGFLGSSGNGLAGLEYQYNSLLAGRPGHATVQVDPYGGPISGGVHQVQPPLPGSGLELTLSTAIQYETEQALRKEVAASHARAGMAVIEDVRSGRILAMASVTSQAGHVGVAKSNLPLTYTYEPGSVMKVATFSGALVQHLITPTTVLSVPPSLNLGGYIFHDAEPHGLENLTATQVIARSSNVGTIEIAKRLGANSVHSWIRRFGFGSPTGLRFPGASSGIVRPVSTWSASAIGSTPIGQDTGVTAMQVLDAYNTVANGGVFVQPQIVKGVVGPGGRLHLRPPARRHRVLPAWAASTLTGMLEHVVSPSGTAPAAAIPGYTVAGKTGTAQKPSTTTRGYVPGSYMATFVGFVPAQAPAISAVVVLDHPKPIYGGSVAAPVFSQICSYALRVLRVPPAGAATPAAAAPQG